MQATASNTDPAHASLLLAQEPETRAVPPEIFDSQTIRLPPSWSPATQVHRYLASLDVIQKQVLVRTLRSPSYSVDLIECPLSEAGPDLILDQDSCVVLCHLQSLPSSAETLIAKICNLSFRYSFIFVLFEAYPQSFSHRSRPDAETLFAYSPPVIKAITKVRRRLVILGGLGQKLKTTDVNWAFADTVDDAALFIRAFGDHLQRCDVNDGVLWTDRAWLDEEYDGEQDLVQVPGMNPFAARVILCQHPLEAFLEMHPNERLQALGALIGSERVAQFNEMVARKLTELESESENSAAGVEELDVGDEGDAYGHE